ncbi:hypothetical protein TrVE_jg13213 [Triparma verrucosa]|uniref:monodehydroascorbate reductase (NADH) n=1 Tax=Triparma verrucosa TaxID=1606542 RepID=A0A9W7FLX3_9STRA|nr:hypothetical protein TrVE_jg13213 [Triparma verrucosa]
MSSYDVVIIGGGVGAGYLVKEVLAKSEANPNSSPVPTIAVVSSDPPLLPPMERPAVSKGSMLADKPFLRNPSGAADKFPYVKTAAGDPMSPKFWETTENVTLLSSTTATSIDFGAKSVALSSGEAITYRKLVLATGSRARVLDGCGAEGSTWDELHSGDLDEQHEIMDKRKYGFGSTHTLNNVGDSEKLVTAMTRVEDDDQETCYWPVVVVGGGFVAMEAAAVIASKCDDLHVTVILNNDHFMGGKGGVFDKEMSEFYERQLSQRFGVRFARNYTVTGLWDKEESGKFCSLDGPAMDLKKTRERQFDTCPKQFTECRGVILDGPDEADKGIRLPARFVVFGVGAKPNSEFLGDSLEMVDGGFMKVDGNCQTSQADVYAIGDVAAMVGEDGEVTKTGHVDAARKMAAHVAGSIMEEQQVPYSVTPYFYSVVMGLSQSWKFYGKCDASCTIVTIGLSGWEAKESVTDLIWGAFYVDPSNVIVGVLLNNGTPEMIAKLPGVVEAGAVVINCKKLKKCELQQVLEDPHLLTPPELGLGEFHAESDVDEVNEVFSQFEKEAGCGFVEVAIVGELMKTLGADWDEVELKDAIAALDETSCGFITKDNFVNWWL